MTLKPCETWWQVRITLPQFEKIKERAGPFLRPGCCRCCDKRWPAHASTDRYVEREDALEAELFTHMQCRLTQNTPKNPKSARNGAIIPNRRFIPNQILQSSNVLRSGTNMTARGLTWLGSHFEACEFEKQFKQFIVTDDIR